MCRRLTSPLSHSLIDSIVNFKPRLATAWASVPSCGPPVRAQGCFLRPVTPQPPWEEGVMGSGGGASWGHNKTLFRVGGQGKPKGLHGDVAGCMGSRGRRHTTQRTLINELGVSVPRWALNMQMPLSWLPSSHIQMFPNNMGLPWRLMGQCTLQGSGYYSLCSSVGRARQ